MSAKFIAQMETSNTCVTRNRLPAAETRPRIVSRSGSPAATSDPKASTRMASVTGQEMSSDVIIACLFASLKSDHMPGAPVRLAVTPVPAASAMSPFSSPAACTISVGLAAAPPWTIAVRPSSDSCGSDTDAMRESSPRIALTRSIVGVRSPSPVTTTMSAYAPCPPKEASICSRAATDSEPAASQPAPESACSARGAKTPSPTARTAQATTTRRTWPAVHAPSRPMGPTAGITRSPVPRTARARARSRPGTPRRRRTATG